MCRCGTARHAATACSVATTSASMPRATSMSVPPVTNSPRPAPSTRAASSTTAAANKCAGCSLRSQCTIGPDARKITRDIDEDIRDRVRALAVTKAFKHSARQRKKVEMAFAHLKRILKMDRLRPRGLSGARYEVLLAATAQNLRKLARYAAPPATPRPA